MNEQIVKLQKEFNRISRKGYIKGIYNSNSSIGLTFEHELGLSINKKSEPDYNGIEIKVRRTYTKSFITLFNAVPSGKNEIERIKNTYGWPCRKNRNYKVIYMDAYGNKLNFAGIKYQYKLEVNYKEEKLYLCIYDKYNNLIDKKTYWTFDSLNERLLKKLKILAIINAWTNQKTGWNYFKYYKIDFYKLKEFEEFLKLIEIGIIKVSFKVDIHLDKEHYGKTYDHGCSFSIGEKDIPKLYRRYYKEKE